VNNHSTHLSKLLRFRYLAVLLISMLTVSCLNDETCEDSTTVNVRIGFYRVQDNNAVRHNIDSLTIFGLGRDSIIYNNTKRVGTVELPMDPSSDSCAFVFVFPEINDTVWIYYQRKPTLTSIECGFVNYYELEEIKHSGLLIQETEIIQSSITSNFEEHIRIYPLVIDIF
jgi:hypothetical protein